jgi:hypothetical protein
MAEQKAVGGGEFKIPFMDNIGGFKINGTVVVGHDWLCQEGALTR